MATNIQKAIIKKFPNSIDHLTPNEQISQYENLLILILLVLSGNPAFHTQTWAASGYAIIAVLLFCVYNKHITKDFFNKFIILIIGFIFIFIIQYFNLGYVSVIYALGFITKALIGAIIFRVLKERFAPRFFDVMVIISLISFPFYVIHIYLGDNILSGFFLGDKSLSIGLYTFRPQVFMESFVRNSGMFWEPGAFQAFINLCLFMNFYRIPFLLKSRKISLFIIVIALISTQSTTGYIIFAVLLGLYILFYSNTRKSLIIVIFLLLVTISVYFYYNLDFLGNKIELQYDTVVDIDGDFDPSRFGALLFDLHYIKKNPFTGNGFHPITRYADHPLLIIREESGEDLGHGNGFSGFIASAGILGMFWYFFTIVYNREGKARDSFLLCGLMIVLLQGEHFLVYPFFLGLSFFKFSYLNEKDVSRTDYLLQ